MFNLPIEDYHTLSTFHKACHHSTRALLRQSNRLWLLKIKDTIRFLTKILHKAPTFFDGTSTPHDDRLIIGINLLTGKFVLMLVFIKSKHLVILERVVIFVLIMMNLFLGIRILPRIVAFATTFSLATTTSLFFLVWLTFLRLLLLGV